MISSNEIKLLHYRYNFWYILGILCVTIIALVSTQWNSIPELVQLITFGLTLTSLFLSLIAIIFSIFSSKTADNLGAASNKISETTENLLKATASIEGKIGIIPNLIGKVQDDVKETRNELINKIEKKETETEPLPTTTSSSSQEMSFLESSSYIGLLMLYAFKIAKEKQKPFNLKEIPKLKEWYGYCLGFYVACSSFGYINVNRTNNMWLVTKMNTAIEDKLSAALDKSIENLTKDGKLFSRENLKKELEEVANYFVDA